MPCGSSNPFGLRVFYLLAAALISLPAPAAVGPVLVRTTPTQAALSFTVTDPAQCTVHVFQTSPTGPIAEDTDPGLFPGADLCNRAGSAFDGTTATFVAGLRTSAMAIDGKLHSRALRAQTHYVYVITDTTDMSTAQGSFDTDIPPAGNLYPEQPPFNPGAWDNRAYPQFDWSAGQRNQILTDPLTGLLVKRITFASDAYSDNAHGGSYSMFPPLAPSVISGGDCSNFADLPTDGSKFATCTGPATVFLPLPALLSSGYDYARNWVPGQNVDDLILHLYGSADAAASGGRDHSESVTVCLAKGVDFPCLSKQFTVTLKKSASLTGELKIPSAKPAPVFANWKYAPLHADIVPTPGTVSVIGNIVNLTTAGQPSESATAFNIDWPVGSRIYIQGSSAWGCAGDYCTIASIQSASQLTTVESCSSSCPTSAHYEGRAFGFKITRMGGSGSIKLSAGYEAPMSSSWSVIEDGVTQHCSSNPVTVSTDAGGKPYPGYTLQGYVCTFQQYFNVAFWLFIPKDHDGSPLGESRPLGILGLPYQLSLNSNGAVFPNGVNMTFAGWDPSSGNRFLATAFYNNRTTALLVAGTYDPSRPGCTPAYTNWSGFLVYPQAPSLSIFPDSCFRYDNLTNPTATLPMDLRSQILRAYANYNPSVDISGFGIGNETVFTAGFARHCLVAAGGGDRSFRVCGTFDSATGNLIQVFDTFSRYPGRWGYVHGPLHAVGAFHALTLDQPEPYAASSSNVLYGPFEMAVTAVNRAGFGTTPNWSPARSGSGTAIVSNEAYACPTGIPQYLIDQGATGNHCIQVRVSSEPCSHTPGSASIYPGGKNEAQQFPCTSTDGSTVINAAWSKLQNLAVGDWMRENEADNDYGEHFIIVTKDVISPTQIEMWLVRGHGVWPNNAQPPYSTISASHKDGFSLAMTSNWSLAAATWVMDATAANPTWAPDNPAWSLIHGTSNVGSSPINKTAIAVNIQDQSRLAGFFDLPVIQQVMRPLPDVAARNPVWAGSTAGYNGPLQDYMNNDQSTGDRRFVVDYRHINPSFGTGPEYRVNASLSATPPLTPLPGTTQVYKIADTDSSGPADPKRLPFVLFAGRFLLHDISSPVTSQHTITDQTNFAACYALSAGECRTDSTAGDRYVSVPFALGEPLCIVNQYEEVSPCFFNATPVVGQIQQMDVSGPFDSTGARQRILPTAFTGIAGQYQFSAPRMAPDGSWMFVPCWWLNGVRSEICAVSMPPLPPPDGVVRSTFVPYPVTISGQPGDQVRVCWGYAENGPVDGSPGSLFPTTRRERGCSIGGVPAATSIPTPVAAPVPFTWASEPPQYAACDSGCNVQMQLIPGRVAYYVIERISGGQSNTSPVGIAVQK